MPFKDPEKVKAKNRAWRERRREQMTDAEKQAVREYHRAWRAARTEEQREKEREYQRQYRAAHPRRRSSSRAAEPRQPSRKTITKPRAAALTPAEFAANPEHPAHGTNGGYTNHRCRCERCKIAHAAQMRQYWAKRRDQSRTP